MVVKHSICVILFIVILYPPSLFQKEEEETRMVVERGFKLILGSQSMARKKILGEMGYDFTIVTADIDEKAIRRDNPQDLVVALAQAKADEIISKLGGQSQFAQDPLPTLLITADTVVVYKGVIREKPTSKEEARQFIKGYSGSHGGVVGSVIISNLKTGVQRAGWDKAEVYFREIPAKVIDDLIDDSITFKVAGGLTLEHPLISPFIDTVVRPPISIIIKKIPCFLLCFISTILDTCSETLW
ncbi:7-methyl-GTP pyrophosphatase isoform X1 [Brassica rapa]|uniref:7-methyl-GTP pyrophosphatase isoform X1 n=1 Tax=Brassica campestris TaxID=3711 RepID=UPI0004F16EFA|nr:7-methyl-GTP pyrophosphatase isoform X1 [Brassica rapa]